MQIVDVQVLVRLVNPPVGTPLQAATADILRSYIDTLTAGPVPPVGIQTGELVDVCPYEVFWRVDAGETAEAEYKSNIPTDQAIIVSVVATNPVVPMLEAVDGTVLRTIN